MKLNQNKLIYCLLLIYIFGNNSLTKDLLEAVIQRFAKSFKFNLIYGVRWLIQALNKHLKKCKTLNFFIYWIYNNQYCNYYISMLLIYIFNYIDYQYTYFNYILL